MTTKSEYQLFLRRVWRLNVLKLRELEIEVSERRRGTGSRKGYAIASRSNACGDLGPQPGRKPRRQRPITG